MMDKMLCIYLVVMNATAFVMMGADKRRARKGRWRISEKALFAAALAGGSAGAILGMQIFRHKTRHRYFVWGMPAILAVQLLLLYSFAG